MIDLCVQTFLNENNYYEERNDSSIVSYIMIILKKKQWSRLTLACSYVIIMNKN